MLTRKDAFSRAGMFVFDCQLVRDLRQARVIATIKTVPNQEKGVIILILEMISVYNNACVLV